MQQKRERKPKQPRKVSRRYLENAALHYLQRYASSSANLDRVLTRRIVKSCTFHGGDPEEFRPVVEELIERYVKAGLLNDSAFAEAKAATLRRQGKSRRAIAAKLLAKGLGKDDIAGALEKTGDTDEDELAAAKALAKRRGLGVYRKKPLKDPADARKELAALGRAGFSYDVARAALQYEEEEEA